MKSMKKILSLVIALAMVLSVAPLAMASGDDGLGGVETEYFWDDFQSVVSDTFPRVLGLTETINGWTRNNSTPEQQYSFEKEGDNIYLQYQNTTGQQNERQIAKALNGTIAAGSNVRITLRYKYPSGAANVFGLYIFGQEFYFRPNVGNFYPGVAGSTQFSNAIVPDKWNNVELLLLSKDDADYYEYYLEGKLISTGKLASRMTSSSALWLRQKLNNAGVTHAKDKYVCFDDIKITTVDEKKICELAAERINIPSSATGNITLPTTGFGGATISWLSDNTSLISNGGVVTRPESGDIQNVILTATVTYGETSVSFPYTVKVLPATVYYYEDFEGATIGSLTNYDNWTGGHSSGSAYDEVFESNIVQQSLTNKSMEIKRGKLPDAGTSGSSFYSVGKSFANAPSSGTISVRMNLYYDNFVWPCISLSDGTKSQAFMFRTNWSSIYNPNAGSNYAQNVQMIAATNHSIEFRINTAEGEIELIFNGRSVLTTSTEITTVSSLSFYENRTGLNGSESTTEKFYIDNIVAELIDVPYAYSVVDFAFKGADGKAALYPEADGSVSGVTIKKHKSAENAVLVAAVYDGGKLTKASAPINVTGALINAETMYSVNLPIASEASQIRVFALDKGTLVPLALDKTYEKRSPITVFIAGDSMAENVAIDNGTLGYQREGWGMRIGEQFISGAISVSNHAVGGRDTSEFISEGRLNSILAKGQRGDFVFVSFGHNDDGSNITLEDYRANLASYSQAIKEKGMTPIFVTSISRIDTGADDSENWAAYDDDLDAYADAMVKEAAENGDVCLDLYTAFNNALSGKTYAEAREYYVPKTVDGTHLSTEGAKLAARLIAELLSETASTLKDLLK